MGSRGLLSPNPLRRESSLPLEGVVRVAARSEDAGGGVRVEPGASLHLEVKKTTLRPTCQGRGNRRERQKAGHERPKGSIAIQGGQLWAGGLS